MQEIWMIDGLSILYRVSTTFLVVQDFVTIHSMGLMVSPLRSKELHGKMMGSMWGKVNNHPANHHQQVVYAMPKWVGRLLLLLLWTPQLHSVVLHTNTRACFTDITHDCLKISEFSKTPTHIICVMVKLHGLVSHSFGDGHPTITDLDGHPTITDLDRHSFRIPILWDG